MALEDYEPNPGKPSIGEIHEWQKMVAVECATTLDRQPEDECVDNQWVVVLETFEGRTDVETRGSTCELMSGRIFEAGETDWLSENDASKILAKMRRHGLRIWSSDVCLCSIEDAIAAGLVVNLRSPIYVKLMGYNGFQEIRAVASRSREALMCIDNLLRDDDEE
jgi:hypothetical protein